MKKQIILIGEGCWFIDSFLYFREHGFDIKVIKTKNSLIWFKDNYDILKNFDAEIVKFSDDKKFYEKLSLSAVEISVEISPVSANLKQSAWKNLIFYIRYQNIIQTINPELKLSEHSTGIPVLVLKKWLIYLTKKSNIRIF